MLISSFAEMPPGTRILLHFASPDDAEDVVNGICASVPDSFRNRARLNESPLLSMDLTGEDDPNGFHDLAVLCGRLVLSAGKKSRFEGLLLLNVSGLLKRREDMNRLKALGEVLSLREGPAGRCVTVFYGASTEEEYLVAADCLDFDGRLTVGHMERPGRRCSVRAALKEAGLTLSGEEAARLLQRGLDEMREEDAFDAVRFLRSCEAGGVITGESVRAALDNPYSYINRFKKMRAILRSPRRIGF